MPEKIRSYQETLAFIHARPRLSFPRGEAAARAALLLERCKEASGFPDQTVPAVHVTGTNGKGSFSTMLSYMLRASGKKTGLFISPYVLCYRERMQINGEMIPEKTLARIIESLVPAVEALDREEKPVNEFILGFAAAMIWFREEGCDITVIEAGIGGAHDATNALPRPLLSVIMGIGLEHTAVLGHTLAEIAGDKSAIIKGNPALLYPEQADEVTETVMKRCAETGSRLIMPSFNEIDIHREDLYGTEFSYGGNRYRLSLLGRYQIKNAVTAITAAETLGVTESAIRSGLEAARFPCRLELVKERPPVLIDGGHNVHGLTALAGSVHALFGENKPFMLTGMMRDKDFSDALAQILPEVSRVYTVTVDNPRSASDHETAEAVRKNGREAIEAGSWKDGLALALTAAEKENKPLLIGGSLFLAADARAELTGERYE